MVRLAARTFINEVNTRYETLHRAFEEQFWGTKMALAADKYSVSELTRTKEEMEAFLADEAKLSRSRELLAQAETAELSESEARTLKIFKRTFGCYIMESATARELRASATRAEGALEDARNKMQLGATMPGKGFVEMSSVGLRNTMRVDPDEAVRKACWEGLRSIGDFVTSNGFVELVRTRNAMARALGYVDFYDYKVTQAEGFGKDELFRILDTLEAGTRGLMVEALDRLEKDKGAAAKKPWNTNFELAGEITKKLDPYFPFEKSVGAWGRSFGALKISYCGAAFFSLEQITRGISSPGLGGKGEISKKLGPFFPFEKPVGAWGRSFGALKISYKGATMSLDLLDRKGKYSNGFCHWPQPAWLKADGSWQPSVTHFTSLADPAAVGSGVVGLKTLMHEAGHAAHFSNIKQPSPLFSQERAPTSVAYAELQSMFLDSLVGDSAWRAKYAHSRQGQPVPWPLLSEELTAKHPYDVLSLRAMIAVPYFEKALYEMPEMDLSAAAIHKLADEVEMRVQGGLSARPLLSVPHILSDEASCYYHGYVLAEMAVHQTRAHFLARDGYIVDNPKVGPTLRDAYWMPGNSEPFLGLVERLTGKPLTGDAWVGALRKPLGELLQSEKAEYDAALAQCAAAQPGEVDLDMRIRIVDGDEVIADTEQDGGFLSTCAKFEKYIHTRYPEVGAK